MASGERLAAALEVDAKWRVASRTVTMFSRRAAAGLMDAEEPFDVEEEAAIAELTQYEPR